MRAPSVNPNLPPNKSQIYEHVRGHNPASICSFTERELTNQGAVVTSTWVGGQQKAGKQKKPQTQRLWRRLERGWSRRQNRWSSLCWFVWFIDISHRGAFVFRQTVRGTRVVTGGGGGVYRQTGKKGKKKVVISADRAYFLSTVSGRWVYVIILLPRQVFQLFSLCKNISNCTPHPTSNPSLSAFIIQ